MPKTIYLPLFFVKVAMDCAGRFANLIRQRVAFFIRELFSQLEDAQSCFECILIHIEFAKMSDDLHTVSSPWLSLISPPWFDHFFSSLSHPATRPVWPILGFALF